MKKYIHLLLPLILTIILTLPAQSQNVSLQVELVGLERTGYSDCFGCGDPDPTWIAQGASNATFGQGWWILSRHFDEMSGTYWNVQNSFNCNGNQWCGGFLINTNNTNATNFSVRLNDGFEKNCLNDKFTFTSSGIPFGSCGPSCCYDNRRTQNNIQNVNNFRNNAPCTWHTGVTPWYGDFRIHYRYRWEWRSAPTVNITSSSNVSLCPNNNTTITAQVPLSSTSTQPFGRHYQWQVSNSTACGGANWQDIPGASGSLSGTTFSYTPPQIAGTRLYRVRVTSNCTANFSTQTTTSSCVRVTYNPMNANTTAPGGFPYGSGDNPPAVQSGICGGTVLPGSTHTLNTLQPPAVGAVANLSGYTWSVASGHGTLSSTSGSSTTWTAPTSPGTYNIFLTYNDACPLSNSQVICQVIVGSPDCEFAYIAPGGTNSIASGGPDNPYASLSYAVDQRPAGTHFRMAAGTYTDNSIVNLKNNIVIEGGYEIINGVWTKTNQATTEITFSGFLTSSVSGVTVGSRIGIRGNNVSGFTIQDLIINTTNVTGSSSNRGRSVYGIHLNGCSNYEILRTTVNPGNATNGLNGTTGLSGANGQNGFQGQFAQGANESTNRNGGSGGNGGVNAWGGFSGGSGGRGGHARGNGARSRPCNGFAGAGPGGSGGTTPGTQCQQNYSTIGCGSCNINNGEWANNNAGDGAIGSPNYGTTNTASPSHTFTTFYIPSGQAAHGGDGRGGGGGAGGGSASGEAACSAVGGCSWSCAAGGCLSNYGNTGGGGGGGGAGGQGGRGGWGGGGSFGIYLHNSNTGSTINQVNLSSGNAGDGGAGGIGGQGGQGGAGGAQIGINNNSPHWVNDRGLSAGGRPGASGGQGGRGQRGAPGVSFPLYRVGTGGSSPANTIPSNSPLVEVRYQNGKACINSEIELYKASGTWSIPGGLSFVNDRNETPGGHGYTTSTPVIRVYSTSPNTSYNLTAPANFLSFLKISGDNRPLPQISVNPSEVCEGTGSIIELSHTNPWGTEVDYDWVIFSASGNNAQNPLITSSFNNPTIDVSGLAVGDYKIRYRVRELCCGWSRPVYTTFTIVEDPTAPSPLSKTTASNVPEVCTGAGGLSVNPATGSTGGAGNCVYEYSFANTDGVWSSWSTTIPVVTADATPGVVSIKARRNCDGNGCDISPETDAVEWIVVEQPEPGVPQAASPASGEVCLGETLEVTVTGGTGGVNPVDEIEYRVGTSGAWTTYTGPFTATQTGEHYFRSRRTSTALGCNASAWNPSGNGELIWVVREPLTIDAHPQDANICPNTGTTFEVNVVSPSTLSYSWELSTDNGANWSTITAGSPYANVNSSTLSINPATLAMDGYLYRAVVENVCGPVFSDPATLNTDNQPIIDAMPPLLTQGCLDAVITIPVQASGLSLTYQWQRSPNGISGWDIVDGSLDGGIYSNYTTANLQIVTPDFTPDGYYYRVIVSGTCVPSLTADPSLLELRDTNLWTGDISEDWHVDGNWGCGVVPTAQHHVTIPTSPSGGRFPIIYNNNVGVAKTIILETGSEIDVETGGELRINE